MFDQAFERAFNIWGGFTCSTWDGQLGPTSLAGTDVLNCPNNNVTLALGTNPTRFQVTITTTSGGLVYSAVGPLISFGAFGGYAATVNSIGLPNTFNISACLPVLHVDAGTVADLNAISPTDQFTGILYDFVGGFPTNAAPPPCWAEQTAHGRYMCVYIFNDGSGSGFYLEINYPDPPGLLSRWKISPLQSTNPRGTYFYSSAFMYPGQPASTTIT